jgi:hypothetical protein
LCSQEAAKRSATPERFENGVEKSQLAIAFTLRCSEIV